MGYNKAFDYYGGNTISSCGVSGQQAGLSLSFSQTNIVKIPFRQMIEVPFVATTIGVCMNYVDIQLIISATCENVNTYQYGVITVGDDVAVDYNTIRRVTNSTASFTVKWKATATTGSSIASSSDISTPTAQSFYDLRILVIINTVALAVLLLLEIWKHFNKSNTADTLYTEKRLCEIYKSRFDQMSHGVNENIRFADPREPNSHMPVASPHSQRNPYDHRLPQSSPNSLSDIETSKEIKNTFDASQKVISLDSNDV